MDTYSDYDGLGLAALVARGEVSPLELTEAAIERIERHNGTLNAVTYKAYDEARAQAKGSLPDGPFKGVPFLIKDFGIQVAGWPRTSGSRFLKDHVDRADTELTRRYREAGFVFLGKTNTPEYAITGTTEGGFLGPCRSPWNPNHITGGSSGGAASATAAGLVPLAHASDGLGSIRIPAACCGLFGLKVTRDRNPNGPGDFDRAIGFSVDHAVTRTVRDSAALLDATGYPEPASPYAPAPKAAPYMHELEKKPGRLRIAWSSETPSGQPIDPEVQTALETTASMLENLGHEVMPRGLGIDYRALYRAQGVVSASNFAADMRRYVELVGREPLEEELEPLSHAALENARRVTGEMALHGWQTLRLLSREILALWEEIDVYLCPVMGTLPPEIGHIDPVNLSPKDVNTRQAKSFPFTPPFNFTGQPSMSMPLHMSATGLPIGMMFTGAYGDEATLFRLAAQLEKECPWADRRPTIWG